ncbi:MAG: ribosome biogenesis GTPase Der [Albidovulum sp.]|nr:ribosome biogenesis GTPase Der [Albidovulum sp.]MDE0532648.1 ribosome biogenesis GTPase Der [Albidovulum sp.]
MTFSLAIVGRPNVGKSTLFNRLVGKRLALVSDEPGVTRDFREGEGKIGDIRFAVIDTAGIGASMETSFGARMQAMTERALEISDACLFLVDARAGILAADRTIADLVRKKAKRVVLAANKSEGRAGDEGFAEAFELGLGEPIGISAEHGEGMGELYASLLPFSRQFESEFGQTETDVQIESGTKFADSASESGQPVKIALIGRPNAGKSTLINRILGEERLLTGSEAGLTRDSISVLIEWNGSPIRIFDTAGMRKRSKVQGKLERLSVADGLRSVRFAEVAVILLDSGEPFLLQDLRLADLAEREGRAVVVAVNKWDLVRDRKKILESLRTEFEQSLPQLRGAPLVPVSAKTGFGLNELHGAIREAWRIWNFRLSTGPLNRWLAAMIDAHPPPAPGGKRIRLRYISQVNARPPGFVIMCSRPRNLPKSYLRYLANGLREEFGLRGTPLRFFLRSQEEQNPYAKSR